MKNKILASLLFFVSFFSIRAQNKDYVVTIKTNYGNMVALLYDETPKHKANFIKLAKGHYYDSLLFHRIIKGFMIQTGDPDSKRATPDQNLGTGGPKYTIPAEFNSKFFHEKGALAAARQRDQLNPKKASSGSQFYIVQGKVIDEMELILNKEKFNAGLASMLKNPVHKDLKDSINYLYKIQDQGAIKKKMTSLIPRIERETGVKVLKENLQPERIKTYSTLGGTPNLDGEYTIFGKVISGLTVIDKIATLRSDRMDRPNEDVRIFVTVEKLRKRKIEKLYAYKYPEK